MWMPKLSLRSFIWFQLQLFEHGPKDEGANYSLIFVENFDRRGNKKMDNFLFSKGQKYA